MGIEIKVNAEVHIHDCRGDAQFQSHVLDLLRKLQVDPREVRTATEALRTSADKLKEATENAS